MKVLIAVDDSLESREAVSTAYEFFGSRPEYTVLSVQDPEPHVIAQRGADAHRDAADLCEYLDRSLTEAAEAALAEAQTVLPADAMETTIMGQTGTAICNLAREHRIDLIVIGSHDKSFWHRLVDPSIGRYLIENAPCAVLVVR